MKAAIEREEQSGTAQDEGRLRKIREESPRAYEPWTEEEEGRLRSSFQRGDSVKAMAQNHGRRPNAIRSRLRKLGLGRG